MNCREGQKEYWYIKSAHGLKLPHMVATNGGTCIPFKKLVKIGKPRGKDV
jgi:hypothetical protein